MDISDKYISKADYDKEILINPSFKTTKIILSNDAYAISDAVNMLIKKIEKVRLNLI